MVPGSNDGVQTYGSTSGVDLITREHVDHVHHVNQGADVHQGADVVQVVNVVQADVEAPTDRAVEEDRSFHLRGEIPLEPQAPWRSWRSWRSFYFLGLLIADAAAAVLALGYCSSSVRKQSVPASTCSTGGSTTRCWAFYTLCVWLAALTLAGSYRAQYPGEGLREYRVPVVTVLRLMALVAIASFAVEWAV